MRAKCGPNETSRQAIVDGTIEVLNEVGYAGLAIETVAARAHVGKATIYRWWPTKPALVLDALIEIGTFDPDPRSGSSVMDSIAVSHITRAITWDSPLSTVLPALALDVLAHPALRERFRDVLRPQREAAVGAIRRAAAAGYLPDGVDAELLIDIFGGTLMYRALITGEGTDEKRVGQLTELLLHGTVPTVGSVEGRE
jgi:AcrR family transcriptional regulator